MRKPFHWRERKGWYLRVPVDGGKLKTIRLGDTKTEAYDEWRKMQSAAEARQGGSLLFGELVAEYIAHLRSEAAIGRLAESSVERRIRHIVPFLVSQQSLPVHELKPHLVTTWLRSQTNWGATTQSDAAGTIKRAVQWAVNEGRVEKNPIESLKVSKGVPRDHVISRDEYETLLSGVWAGSYARRSATSFRPILIALRLSGCRPSEIVNLRVEDFDGETWTIAEHKNRKKKPRPRVVYLPPCLRTLSRISARGRKSGPLFLAGEDRGWKYHDMRLRFQRLREKTGISKKCVLYSFRHTWITDALLAGVDVATVAEMAGTSIQMIDRHYGHLSQHRTHLTDAAVKIGAARVATVG